MKLQKEKLALELEVLRLSQGLGPATPPTTSATPCATGKSDAGSKKRNIDWPQDCVPGMSMNTEFNSLDLPSFVAGYLAMICTYDPDSNARMLAILEVLMAKAISYTWASVRGFYSYLARQVELRRLDWDCIPEIRDMAATFFKHSDLRSTHSKNLNSSSPSPPSGSSPQDPATKGCQAWNYKGTCSCYSTASNYASHHLCRVCKSSEHPMLPCPKRKMPIPNQPLLDRKDIGLTAFTDYDTDSDMDTKTEHNMLSKHDFFSANSLRAVVAHILAANFPQPNAFGAKIPVSSQLRISVWRHYLTDFANQDVVEFLQFGWPINYTSSVLPQSTNTNHSSALAYPEDVKHYLSTELSVGALAGPFKENPLPQDLITSPLQTVHKRGSTRRRVVIDLSFSHTASVNQAVCALGLRCILVVIFSMWQLRCRKKVSI